MKPITSGFCADACPASPNAAAPAALPNRARRPNLNPLTMIAPSSVAVSGLNPRERSPSVVPAIWGGKCPGFGPFRPRAAGGLYAISAICMLFARWHPFCMQSTTMQTDTPTLAPTPPPTLAEKLATAIADGILNGTLKPGLRLDEISLAQQHGVSRTPVRHALRHLPTPGLLALRP